MFRRRERPVVDTVADQTKQAAHLAGIADQNLLGDPRTNPATRGHADTLRDEQQKRGLDLEHRRALRRGRVSDNRAAHAERTLEAIQAARETASPALAVAALHVGRVRFMGVSLAASIALSVGSALGVEAAAQAWGAPDGVGYLAEVGMTGLATTVILYRSHLTQHRGKVAGWQNKVLWALMLAPLLGSIVASTTGSGPVGAACSIGAAAFALLAYVVADRSSAAMRDAASLVDQADETELRAQAAGEDLFTLSGLPGAVPERRPDGDADRAHDESADPDPDAWIYGQSQSLAEEIEAFLGEDPPGQPARTNGVGPDTPGGFEGAHKPLPRSGQPEDDTTPELASSSVSEGDGGEANELVIPANQARRLRSLETMYRVAEYRAARPDSSADDVAEHIGASVSTARKYLRQLKQIQGGEE